MALSKQPYKGARDFYPEDFRVRQYIFDKWQSVAESFGYEPYDAPLIEPLDIYRAKTGNEIVNEQTYSFLDRGKREVAIRPEMTPSVARMVAARKQELTYPLRLYSIPNVWRYERPQKGRLREHWQLNADIFGVENQTAELEMVQMAEAIMRAFGATEDMFVIKLNSRRLMEVLLQDYFELSEEQRLAAGRLIDKMHKMDEPIFEKALAELVGDRFDELHKLLHANQLDALPESVREYAQGLEDLLAQLKEVGGNVEYDVTLMRGFDYYTDIVFEVFDKNPGNPRSIFGGGRYDGLVSLFGSGDVPAVGFGVGDVTTRDFLETHKLLPQLSTATRAYVVALQEDANGAALKLAAELRSHGINTAVDTTGRKAAARIRTADKKTIPYVVFVGSREVKSGKYKAKRLSDGVEQTKDLAGLVKLLG